MSKNFQLYCTKHLSQNICKTPQNTAKQSQNAFCEITSQNKHRKTNAKRSKKSQNRRITAAIRIARIRCIFQKYFRPVAKVHNAQQYKYA